MTSSLDLLLKCTSESATFRQLVLLNKLADKILLLFKYFDLVSIKYSHRSIYFHIINK